MKIIKHGLITLALTAGAPALASVDAATSAQQYGSYVILGQTPTGDNVAIARTVIDSNLTCPTVSAVGSSASPVNMITRDNPTQFPVMVCEALIGFDQAYQLNFADKAIALAVAKSNPQNIQVFGDTGCKTAECALGQPANPFQSLANDGAKAKPDLVLHMGDYNYRGTGGQIALTMQNSKGELAQTPQWTYDAGDSLSASDHCGQQTGGPFYSQSAVNGNRPDSWQYWQNDLFMSSSELMAAAPWIVSRGNHELCSRAGPGYFYFLDPNSNLVKGQQQMSCPTVQVNKGAIVNSVQVPNYIVQFKQLNVAVIDSANACDAFTGTAFDQVYKNVFTDLNAKVKPLQQPTWLITHRPIWGVEAMDGDKSTPCSPNSPYSCINQMMQKAIDAQPSKKLDEGIKLVLTGHMHKFESVSFKQGSRPPNIIVGSSGVELAGSEPSPTASVTVDNLAASVLTTNTQVTNNGDTYDAFGYFQMTLGTNGAWQGQLVNPAKNLTLVTCSSEQNLAQGVCELAPGISVVTN